VILSALFTDLKKSLENSIVVVVSFFPVDFPVLLIGADSRMPVASTVLIVELVAELIKLILTETPSGNPFFAFNLILSRLKFSGLNWLSFPLPSSFRKLSNVFVN